MRYSATLISFSLLFFLLALPATVNAAEQRCNELGANCVCSEPFNTNTYTGSIPNWNPADSTSLQCSQELGNHPVARNSPVSGTNDATVLAALPAGHQVQYALWAGNNNVGIFFMGNALGTGGVNDCGPGWERCEVRIYVYKSSNFQPTNSGSGGSCSGDKHAEIIYTSGPDSVVNPAQQVSGDGMSIYNFLPGSGWTPTHDCCIDGPRLANDYTITGAQQRGKWWRFSHIIRNPAGGSGASRFHFEIYAKNVTDNQPEVKIMDTEGFGNGAGTDDWNGPYNTVTPPSRAKTVAINGYREGTCAGFETYSHLMVAHWATDAGQRIGPAYEIEGKRPSAPTNLRTR